MAIRKCNVSKPHFWLVATMTYSVVLSMAYMSYIYYHDWKVITYPNSPFQKGIHKWTYSASSSNSISRSFFQELREVIGWGGQPATARPGVRFDVLHRGYRDLTYEPLKLMCSQCAIISSSGHLINTSAGAEIDSTPCILRMNNAPTLGYEKDVGSRTTIRSMGHVNLIKSFEKNSARRKEMFSDNRTKAEIILLNWMNTVHVDVYSDQQYRYALLLAHLYPDVHFYAFTPEKMNETQELFKNETGIYSSEANTWLSTGWFTMVAAMDICQEIVVYGMAHEDFCQNATTDKAVKNVPYHYYEPDKLKECQYYNKSETTLTSGHLFITEKAVFANWAVQNKKLKFKYPSWPIKNQTDNLDTPFFNKFWAFIKKGGNMTELRKKKAPPKKISRRRRRRRKGKEKKVVIVTLQKGNESIKVNQDELVDTLVELLPDVKLIQTDEYVEITNASSSKGEHKKDSKNDSENKLSNADIKKELIEDLMKEVAIDLELDKNNDERERPENVNDDDKGNIELHEAAADNAKHENKAINDVEENNVLYKEVENGDKGGNDNDDVDVEKDHAVVANNDEKTKLQNDEAKKMGYNLEDTR